MPKLDACVLSHLGTHSMAPAMTVYTYIFIEKNHWSIIGDITISSALSKNIKVNGCKLISQ